MITKEDLLKESSQKELQELSDLNATGTMDEAVIQDAIDDAIAFIKSFIPLPHTPTQLLRQIATKLAIFNLKAKNEIPVDEEERKRCEEYLLKMAAKKIPAGVNYEDPHPKARSFAKTASRVETKGFL